jgi:hypothetical protein
MLTDYVDWTKDARTRLERESWFCFGRVNRPYEDPLFINRLDGSVWSFPSTGYIWLENDQFLQFAESLGSFLENYVFGPGYLTFSGASKREKWWHLLQCIGCAE